MKLRAHARKLKRQLAAAAVLRRRTGYPLTPADEQLFAAISAPRNAHLFTVEHWHKTYADVVRLRSPKMDDLLSRATGEQYSAANVEARLTAALATRNTIR